MKSLVLRSNYSSSLYHVITKESLRGNPCMAGLQYKSIYTCTKDKGVSGIFQWGQYVSMYTLYIKAGRGVVRVGQPVYQYEMLTYCP